MEVVTHILGQGCAFTVLCGKDWESVDGYTGLALYFATCDPPGHYYQFCAACVAAVDPLTELAHTDL